MMALMNDESLRRLGRYVIARRQELGYLNRIDLARDLQGELTDRTLSDIENGDKRSSTNTYTIVERALRWQPGSVDTILSGGEPIEKTTSVDPETAKPPLSIYSSGELVAELRNRLDWAGLQLTDDTGWRAVVAAEEAGLLPPSLTTKERRTITTITEGRRAKRAERIAPRVDYARTQTHL